MPKILICSHITTTNSNIITSNITSRITTSISSIITNSSITGCTGEAMISELMAIPIRYPRTKCLRWTT